MHRNESIAATTERTHKSQRSWRLEIMCLFFHRQQHFVALPQCFCVFETIRLAASGVPHPETTFQNGSLISKQSLLMHLSAALVNLAGIVFRTHNENMECHDFQT